VVCNGGPISKTDMPIRSSRAAYIAEKVFPLSANRLRRVSKLLAGAFLRCISIALVLVAVPACRGLSPDWNGTWKLNPAMSDIPGPTITVSITPDGEYHNEAHGVASIFRCNGKEFAVGIFTAHCTQQSDSEMEITFSNNSKTRTVHWQVSPDGTVLTIKAIMVQADGSLKSKESRYTRTSGSNGFVGGWRNVDPLESTPSLWQIRVATQGLHYSFPQEHQQVDAVLDGTDAPVRGPAIPGGSSIALMERSPRELGMTKKRNGQVISVGYLRISADGGSLTETYWSPSSPSQKAVLVYEKQ
jgi:hypothetical protein